MEPEASPLVFDEDDHLAESQGLTVKAGQSTYSKMNKRDRNTHSCVIGLARYCQHFFPADLQMSQSLGSAY